MVCVVEVANSLNKCEFMANGPKQRILIEILLKYTEYNITSLAAILDASAVDLQKILNETYFFVDDRANDLAQLFLISFGRMFFTHFAFSRKFE